MGGATYDVCLRYLKEDPWERLRRIKEVMPNTKVLTLAQLLIDPSIQSWHIFRRYRLKRVYRFLREYKLHKLRLMILARLLYGK